MIPNRIARLNANGATDNSFAPGAGLDAEGICVNLNAAGQVVAGGVFNRVSGSARAKLALFEANGTLITGTPTPSATVRTLATQVSGETILGGDFTSINGTPRGRIARLLPNRALEAGFNPNALGSVHALALQTDGKILAGGNFTTVGAIARNNVVRLYNGEASDRLYAVNTSVLRWRRTGTNELTKRVTFEIDKGSGYGPLAGTITQTATEWQITLSTPLSGATNNIRATAFSSDSHSSGTHQTITSIPVLPEIRVQVGINEIQNGGTVTFPKLQVGEIARATVTIFNAGLAVLTLTSAVTISGQWQLESQPFSAPHTHIPSQTSVSFNIVFVPTNKGVKNGTLTIISNDTIRNPFLVQLAGEATAGPGGQDLTWQPNANNRVFALAKSSDANVWLGGDFTTVRSSSRPRLARVDLPIADEEGVVKEVTAQLQSANIIPTGVIVSCIAQLPDGTALIGGLNTSKLYWVGFSQSGEVTLKASFTLLAYSFYSPPVTPNVECMAVEADGSVLIGGLIGGLTIGNVTKKGLLIRIKFGPDSKGVIVASIDTTFSTNLTLDTVRKIAVQTDGKIVICAGPKVLRINSADGSPDATFSSPVSFLFTSLLAIDSQGRILVGGGFYQYMSFVDEGVRRLSSTGAIDSTFQFVESFSVQCLLPMVNGTLFLADTNYSSACLRRILNDGTADTSFVSEATGVVRVVCSQENGALLIGGNFSTDSGPFTTARIINNPVSTSLTIVDATTVQWLRSGALPETQVVVFDVSQDEGVTWNRLGQGRRITGGWQLTSISLPFLGVLRARAYIQSAGSSSIMENQISFAGLSVADLFVQVPGENRVEDNGTATPVTSQGGEVRPVTVTLHNSGLAPLTGVDATVTTTPLAGTGRWVLAARPNGTIEVGESATMVVEFRPQAGDRGEIFANLEIKSSIPGVKNPYLVKLVGAALTQPLAALSSAVVTPGGAGIVDFKGLFTPNDYGASAYFRYGPMANPESTWVSTSVSTLSGFGTAQQVIKQVDGLTIGVKYGVRAVITNSLNVTKPNVSANRIEFTPKLA